MSNLNYRNILIDINGDKKPNIFGKDIFVFGISQNTGKFLPYGVADIGTPDRRLTDDTNRAGFQMQILDATKTQKVSGALL